MPEPVDSGQSNNQPRQQTEQQVPQPPVLEGRVVRAPQGQTVNVTPATSMNDLARLPIGERGELEDHPPALQEWVEADRTGNTLWPQSGTGILLHVTSAVAESLGRNGVDWTQFSTSILTDQQVAKLGAVINGLHEHYQVSIVINGQSIPLRYKTEGQPGEFFIGQDNIQELWNREKYGVVTLAYNFMNDVLTARDPSHAARPEITMPTFSEKEGRNGFPFHAIGEVSPQDLAHLEAFFADPANAVEVDLFKKLLASSVDTMGGSEGQSLAKEYRDDIAFRSQEEIRADPNLRARKAAYIGRLRTLITQRAQQQYRGVSSTAVEGFFGRAFTAGRNTAPQEEAQQN